MAAMRRVFQRYRGNRQLQKWAQLYPLSVLECISCENTSYSDV